MYPPYLYRCFIFLFHSFSLSLDKIGCTREYKNKAWALFFYSTRFHYLCMDKHFESYLPTLKALFPDVQIDYFQSNIEGALIDKMQQVGFDYDGIVLNAGAYTHTSIALLDCIRSLRCPTVEVHISNVHQREEYRHHSMISAGCLGVICGFGLQGYELAIRGILAHQSDKA